MKRYLRLYLYFLQFSFSKAMEFRLDFSFRIFMDCMYYAANIGLFKVLFLHSDLIAGWSEPQMTLFVCGYLLVDALGMTIFSTNMWWLPYYINRGELDYYLIRPVSPLFFLSVREFSANSFVNLIIAVGLMGHAFATYPIDWSVWQLLGYLGLLLNGVMIHYCLHMLTILPVFWTQSSRGFIDLFYTLGISMERPDRIFKGAMRVLFTVILPFSLIASFPARAFIEGFTPSLLIHITCVTIGIWMILLFVWRKGLANYSSASS